MATTSLTTGTRLGPYEILEPLGSGGMGEVWKARDTRLNRIVAVKRLTARHADRFEQEAHAIAALNHPHICQIHDVGPDYLVLEYIEGRPLYGPLPVTDVLNLGIQIASALAEAHGKGVLHRDLKPANIIVSRSSGSDSPTAKLLDFGLAKLVDQDDDATRTIEGTVLGTASYMSPEQAEGKLLDARSDIFSFGAVLYEALSGSRAFEGTSTLQVLNAVVHDSPLPLQVLPALEIIVRRCLEKDPGLRFQTMSELRSALEETAGHQLSDRSSEHLPSVAVLPFADMSPNKDQGWFGDGLAEEIINALTHIPGLKVIARTSAFAFKGKQEDVRRIAQALGVANVLEGSVRKAGNRVRVTAQLITAADGSHLWSDRYDRELADIFAIQDDIAQAITAALKLTLAEPAGRSKHRTHNPAAYEAFLKGRYFGAWSGPTQTSLHRSRENFEQAIALDPTFALAHIGLGYYFLTLAIFSERPAREVMPLVRSEAIRALDLEPSLLEGHALLAGVTALYDYDWSEADRQLRLAKARDSFGPFGQILHGWLDLLIGRLHDAIKTFERGLVEDPLNLMNRYYLAMGLIAAGRDTDGARQLHQMLDLDDKAWIAHGHLSMHCASLGQVSEALECAERAYSLAPWDVVVAGVFAGLSALTGDTSRAQSLLQQLQAGEAHRSTMGFICFHLICGEMDQAAEWAQKGIEQRHPTVAHLLISWPIGRTLRSSSRWPALARMMNLKDGRPLQQSS